jgi:transposase InsO family protein
VPKKIISDRGSVFIGRFWTSFQEALGTQLNFSTAYHPEIDGQTERTNQTLEDMLRMYVMDQQKRWEEFLPLVEFAYNNSYQSTIKMAPFEFLAGIGRGSTHGGASPHFRSSHSTVTTSNGRSGQGPVGQL